MNVCKGLQGTKIFSSRLFKYYKQGIKTHQEQEIPQKQTLIVKKTVGKSHILP